LTNAIGTVLHTLLSFMEAASCKRRLRFRPRERVTNAAAGSPEDKLSKLSDIEMEKVFSFLTASFQDLTAVAPLSHRMYDTSRAMGSWEGATIIVPASSYFAQGRRESLLKLVQSWGHAAEVHFAAHRATPAVMRGVSLQWPELKLTTDGIGPYSLFCMMSRPIPPGVSTMLHFFEPRYRWMCKRMKEAGKPYYFGWVTGFQPNLFGSLCEVNSVYEAADGTFDASFTCIARFSVVESWEESVPGMPRAPKLTVGYLKTMDPEFTLGQTSRTASEQETWHDDYIEEDEEEEEEEEEDEGSSAIDE